MIYTELTKRAMRIAFDAHKEQTDKSGMPYIYHPIHLAEQMMDEDAVCVALLHDVLEDTDVTFEQLAMQGFGETILEALVCLTHEKAMPYMQYIENIKKDPLARTVKLADLHHNSDLSRLSQVDDAAKRRVEKYREAIAYLQT